MRAIERQNSIRHNDERLAALERRLTRMQRSSVLLLVFGIVMAAGAWRANVTQNEVRTRALVIVDEQGRERIVMGSPVPDLKEGKRMAPGTGIVVNDTAGYERFGLNLFPDGRMTMGFDAPPGTGDDRNRERISLVADGKGGAYIRFLDRKTQAKAFLALDEDNEVYLDLLDWDSTGIKARRIGARGDTSIIRTR